MLPLSTVILDFPVFEFERNVLKQIVNSRVIHQTIICDYQVNTDSMCDNQERKYQRQANTNEDKRVISDCRVKIRLEEMKWKAHVVFAVLLIGASDFKIVLAWLESIRNGIETSIMGIESYPFRESFVVNHC